MNYEILPVLQLRGSYRVVLEAPWLQTSICNAEHVFVMAKSGFHIIHLLLGSQHLFSMGTITQIIFGKTSLLSHVVWPHPQLHKPRPINLSYLAMEPMRYEEIFTGPSERQTLFFESNQRRCFLSSST